MTKQKAKDLEIEIDEIFTKAIEDKCYVSMALTGKLRITKDENFVNFDIDTGNADWVHWIGYYDELKDFITKSILAIRQNKDKIQTLMNLYHNRRELESEE